MKALSNVLDKMTGKRFIHKFSIKRMKAVLWLIDLSCESQSLNWLTKRQF